MESKKIKIGNRVIGKGEKCFIIAEAGSNHDRKGWNPPLPPRHEEKVDNRYRPVV